MTWTHNGLPFDTQPLEYWGFVYLIENKSLGKWYVGKKFFTKSKIRQVKGKKKKSRVDSGWQDYWGSSATLLADLEKYGKEGFTREILHFCKTKAECTFWESFEIFTRNALRSPHSYNDWVSCRIRKAHLGNLQLKES